MIEIELIIKGAKGDIIIKGSNIDEVLNEYESNKDKIKEVLGEISVKRPIMKKKPPLRPLSLAGRITALKDEGFFDKPKDTKEVRKALKDRGYPYTFQTVSIGLLRLVRKKELRRIVEEKEGKEVYVYVIP